MSECVFLLLQDPREISARVTILGHTPLRSCFCLWDVAESLNR